MVLLVGHVFSGLFVIATVSISNNRPAGLRLQWFGRLSHVGHLGSCQDTEAQAPNFSATTACLLQQVGIILGVWLMGPSDRSLIKPEKVMHPKDAPKPRGECVSYSRKFPEQDRAIEAVFHLIRLHPEGVTVNDLNELIRSHQDKIQSEVTWFHSIDVLIDEGKLYSCAKWREKGYLESFKLFAR